MAKILQTAMDYSDRTILITHFDAGSRKPDKAYKEHFEPARDKIEEERKKGVMMCEHLLPVIPIREIEAWMLADADTLCKTLKTKLTPQELGLPAEPKLVEKVADPKQVLEQALQKVRDSRRWRNQAWRLSDLYVPLGNDIRLDQLEKVPAYKDFVDRLTAVVSMVKIDF